MKYARLTTDDRINIQSSMYNGLTLSQVARKIKKSRSTIYREIMNHLEYRGTNKNCMNCIFKCSKYEKSINIFSYNCKKHQPKGCTKWNKFPFTCNGCSLNSSGECILIKRYYDFAKADTAAKKIRSLTRTYIGVDQKTLENINKIVTDGVRKGQSIHHIYITNYNILNVVCEGTIRNYIYRLLLDIKPGELRRFCRLKRKNRIRKAPERTIGILYGRTFSDYQKYTNYGTEKNIWQMDSVIGRQVDKKAILTITYPPCRFQFGLLIDKQNPNDVYEKMRLLQNLFGDDFKDIFEVLLADNGVEFYRLNELETNENGELLCKTFFTNPYKSTDKASCERNHEFIRYVIPKGIKLDDLTQEKLNLLFSHINSYVRKSNQEKTPYEAIVERFGINFPKKLNICEIEKTQVNLTKSLLK